MQHTAAEHAAGGFLPHGVCYRWDQALLWTHFSSDLLIGASYVVISVALAYLVHRVRRDIPFSMVFVAFGLFIITCGLTHFMEVWTLWQPYYWLAGSLKVVTAVASVATAAAMPFTIPRAVTTVRDARLSRERDIAAARAEAANRAKMDFLAMMSHELRTPLNAIAGYAELMETGIYGEPTAQQQEALGRIRKSQAHLSSLIDDILNFARIEAGSMQFAIERFDAAKVVEETLHLVEPHARSRSIVLSAEPCEGQIPVTGDEEKTRQVLLNLLSNALKLTPPEGTVTVSCSAAEQWVEFRVRDTGPGIPLDDHERIFLPFVQLESGLTRKVGGTGLGLSISRDLVKGMGGEIEVRSEQGRGAEFVVRLPKG